MTLKHCVYVFPDYQQASCQRRYCQQLDHNAGNYNGSLQMMQQPPRNQAFAVQSQCYNGSGSHSQVMHGAQTDFNRQVCRKRHHHSPVHRSCEKQSTTSAAGEYSTSWYQSMSCMNSATDTGAANCNNQYCDFTEPCQAVNSKTRLHIDPNMHPGRRLTNGFGAPTSIQRGFVGDQHLLSAAGPTQNHCVTQDYETNMFGMNQLPSTGADRQQRMYGMYQLPGAQVEHQQTVGFAGRRPRQFVPLAQHLVNSNPQQVTIPDAPTSYQNPSVVQPSQSFAVQQPMSWNQLGNSHSYTESGCYVFLLYKYCAVCLPCVCVCVCHMIH